MRRIITALTILGVVIYSCSNNKSTEQTGSAKQDVDSSELFLKLFTKIDGNNLHVYTPTYDLDHGNKFNGRKIDFSFYKFLKFKTLSPKQIDTSFHNYACYKFKLTDNKTGLIIRTPSKYSDTAIDLYTWDNQTKKITNIINLADGYGEEGWHFAQDAWLQDLNQDKLLDLVTFRKDYNPNWEYPEKKPVKITDSLFVYMGKTNGEFVKTLIKVDTNSYKLFDFIDKMPNIK